MGKQIKIGLVVPGAEDRTPLEGAIMYPGMTFVPRGTGVASLTPAGYDQAADKIIPAADDLHRQGVDAIMLMGTSLTFYRGPQVNEDLQKEVRKRTGLPVSSMSTAIVDGLREVGATKLAVGANYTKPINDRLEELLRFHGFDVLSLESFDNIEFGVAVKKSEQEIIDLAAKAHEKAPAADGMVISCGGFRTLNVTKPLEEQRGLPVVSSMPAAFWAAMRLVGESGQLFGYGRLLENSRAPAAAA